MFSPSSQIAAHPSKTALKRRLLIWLNHHAMFHLVQHIDRNTLIFNMLLLMIVCFIPFSTSVLTTYGILRDGVFLYGGTLTAMALAYNLLWYHAARHVDSGTCDRRTVILNTVRNLSGRSFILRRRCVRLSILVLASGCFSQSRCFISCPVKLTRWSALAAAHRRPRRVALWSNGPCSKRRIDLSPTAHTLCRSPREKN